MVILIFNSDCPDSMAIPVGATIGALSLAVLSWPMAGALAFIGEEAQAYITLGFGTACGAAIGGYGAAQIKLIQHPED